MSRAVDDVTAPVITAEEGLRGRPVLLWILIASIVLRLSIWVCFRDLPIHIDDEKDYEAIATNLARTGEFAQREGSPTSIRPPLFPAVVAAVYRLFGMDNLQAVRLVQAALSVGTIVILYYLGLTVASRSLGLWTAGLYSVYPTLLAYNTLLLTEVLFTFLLMASCLAVARYYRSGSTWLLALTGILLGLAALTRSVVWLSPPFLAIWVVMTGEGRLLRRVLGAAAFLVAFTVTIAPWTVRNTRLQHTLVTIDTMGGRNLMMGNYRYTPLYRSWDAISLTGERSWIHEINSKYPHENLTQGQLDKLAMKEGVAFIKAHPGLTLKRDLIKFFDFWGLERELIAGALMGYFGPVPRSVVYGSALLIFASYAAVIFLALFGILLRPLDDRRIHWFFILVILFICMVHSLVFGHSRYHLPLIPLLLIYSSRALLDARGIWQQRRRPAFALASALCLLLVAGWVWGAVAGDWERLRTLLGT